MEWNTEIASGISLAKAELTSKRARRFADKVMIVLTDGFPTSGDAIAAAKDAIASNINVYAITFGDEADQDYMKLVAAAGQGEHAHADDEETFARHFQKVRSQSYLLVQ